LLATSGFGFDDGGRVGGAPVGDGFPFRDLLLPRVDGDIPAQVAGGFGIKVDGRVEDLALGEGAL
jgi:hypothetical protein